VRCVALTGILGRKVLGSGRRHDPPRHQERKRPMTDGRGVRTARTYAEVGIRGKVRPSFASCVVFVLTACLYVAAPALAFGSAAPHVVDADTPEACAMCHRAHTAPGVVERTMPGTWETTGSALVITEPTGAGDTTLCFACHGIDTLGSGTGVQDDFAHASAHVLAPDTSAYGPTPKQCSSCHDAHGAARTPTDEPWQALLRALTSDGTERNTAEEFCATCHFEARAPSAFRGLTVYRDTAHAGLTPRAGAAQITCGVCHEPHGSAIAPLIRTRFSPPSAPATVTIASNDRTMCYVCHTLAGAGTAWSGEATYTASSHGSTIATVAPLGEWASRESTRLAGECQSCHNPMGREDGRGGVITALADAEGRELCYRCHDGQTAATDFKAMAVPTDLAGDEVVVAYDPLVLPHAYSSLHVWTPANTPAPRALEGPRRYVPSAPEARSGSVAVAYGGIDGDAAAGEHDLVVADPSVGSPGRVHVYRYNLLDGIAATSYSLEATASLLTAGDFLLDASGRPEAAVVSVDADGASTLRFYRHDGTTLTSALATSFPLGYDATGIAGGTLGLGIAPDQLVVTARSAAATDSPWAVYVVSQADTATVAVTSFETLHPEPRGPSIGPVLAGGAAGIAVADAGAATPSISVYAPASADAVPEATRAVFGTVGARAWDTVIGPFMAGSVPGVAVAVRNESGMNAVTIFETGATGLGARVDVETGMGVASAALAAGDVNGDGVAEIAIANAGTFSRTPGVSVPPSLQTLVRDGATFVINETAPAGGVELAGTTPGIVVADLGPVGRSRHPASAVAGAHVSGEQGAFPRHVECVDCHNVHVADGSAAVAPVAYGVLKGSSGYDPVTGTLKPRVDYEYETCFKCHGPATWGGSPRDVAAEFDSVALGGSAHPVTGDHPASGARIYCVDCHGNASASQPIGPHTSPASPLLKASVIGIEPGDAGMLCYRCHASGVYRDGTDGSPQVSRFYDATSGAQLHARHVDEFRLSCQTCHTNHGSVNRYLIRSDVDWVDAAPNGGACYTSCHLGSTANAYSRIVGEAGPTAITAPVNDGVTGGLADVLHQDGAYYVVDERQGSPAMRVEIGFTGLTATPVALRLWGRYDPAGVALGHNVVVRAWDFAAATPGWVTLGKLPAASVNGLYTYPIAHPRFVSGSGELRIQIDHTSGGHQDHRLYLDRVWLQN